MRCERTDQQYYIHNGYTMLTAGWVANITQYILHSIMWLMCQLQHIQNVLYTQNRHRSSKYVEISVSVEILTWTPTWHNHNMHRFIYIHICGVRPPDSGTWILDLSVPPKWRTTLTKNICIKPRQESRQVLMMILVVNLSDWLHKLKIWFSDCNKLIRFKVSILHVLKKQLFYVKCSTQGQPVFSRLLDELTDFFASFSSASLLSVCGSSFRRLTEHVVHKNNVGVGSRVTEAAKVTEIAKKITHTHRYHDINHIMMVINRLHMEYVRMPNWYFNRNTPKSHCNL